MSDQWKLTDQLEAGESVIVEKIREQEVKVSVRSGSVRVTEIVSAELLRFAGYDPLPDFVDDLLRRAREGASP